MVEHTSDFSLRKLITEVAGDFSRHRISSKSDNKGPVSWYLQKRLWILTLGLYRTKFKNDTNEGIHALFAAELGILPTNVGSVTEDRAFVDKPF